MKEHNNIADWYRNELDNYSVKPAKDAWQSLADDLDSNEALTDKNFSEWYKKEADKLAERPDYTVWEKLSTELDTASVWDRLVVSLNSYDKFIWWRNLTLKLGAISLFLLGSYLAYDNHGLKNQEIAQNRTEKAIKTTKSYNNVPEKIDTKSLNKELNKINSYNNKKSYSNKRDNQDYHQKKYRTKRHFVAKHNIKEQANNEEELLASTSKYLGVKPLIASHLNDVYFANRSAIELGINRRQINEEDISHLFISKDFLVKKDKNKIIFNSKRFLAHFVFGIYARRIYVGINAGFKKQGMINFINKNSVLAKYKQTNYLDFGQTYGATVGLIVSDKFNVETNVNFNSTAGYKRDFSFEGNTVKEDLNLNYTSISILAKKMANKSTFDNKKYSSNFIAGIYGSYLTSSNVNGVAITDYKKSDFGIVLGFEQDRYLTKSLIITPSIRFNQGLMNISKTNTHYNSSRNFSLAFNLGIKYIFLKKG